MRYLVTAIIGAWILSAIKGGTFESKLAIFFEGRLDKYLEV